LRDAGARGRLGVVGQPVDGLAEQFADLATTRQRPVGIGVDVDPAMHAGNLAALVFIEHDHCYKPHGLPLPIEQL